MPAGGPGRGLGLKKFPNTPGYTGAGNLQKECCTSEFKAAVLKTKEIYNLSSDEEALSILRQLDVRDGVKDNVVNLWNWPNLMHHDSSFFKENTPLDMAKPGELIGLETVFQYEVIQVRNRRPRSSW